MRVWCGLIKVHGPSLPPKHMQDKICTTHKKLWPLLETDEIFLNLKTLLHQAPRSEQKLLPPPPAYVGFNTAMCHVKEQRLHLPAILQSTNPAWGKKWWKSRGICLIIMCTRHSRSISKQASWHRPQALQKSRSAYLAQSKELMNLVSLSTKAVTTEILT